MDKTIENVNYILEYTSKRVLKSAKEAENELDEFRSSMNDNPDDKELNTLATLRKNAIQKRAVANYYQKKFDNIIKNSKDGIEEFLVVASVDEDLGQTYENKDPNILMVNLDEICKDVTSEAVTVDIMNAFSPYAGSATPEDIRIDFGIDSLENEEEISNVIDELYEQNNRENSSEDNDENTFAIDLGENIDSGSATPDPGVEEMYSSVSEYGYNEHEEDSTEDETKGSFAPDDVRMGIEDDIILDDFYESDVAGSVTPEELRVNIDDDTGYAGSSTPEELRVNIEEGNPYAGSSKEEDIYINVDDGNPFAGSTTPDIPVIYEKDYSENEEGEPVFDAAAMAGSNAKEELRIDIDEFDNVFAGSSAHYEDEEPIDEEYSYENDMDTNDHPFAGSNAAEEIRVDVEDDHPFAGSSAHYENDELISEDEDDTDVYDSYDLTGGSSTPEELKINIEDEEDENTIGSSAHYEDDEVIVDEIVTDEDEEDIDNPFAGSSAAEELRVYIDDMDELDVGSSANDEGELDDDDIEDFLNEMKAKMLNDDLESE